MELCAKERNWLPIFGKTGKIALGKACWLNKNRKSILEQTFTSIAETRVHTLTSWVELQWSFLNDASIHLTSLPEHEWANYLQHLLTRNNDFSELFIATCEGEINYSSYPNKLHYPMQQDILAKG